QTRSDKLPPNRASKRLEALAKVVDLGQSRLDLRLGFLNLAVEGDVALVIELRLGRFVRGLGAIQVAWGDDALLDELSCPGERRYRLVEACARGERRRTVLGALHAL